MVQAQNIPFLCSGHLDLFYIECATHICGRGIMVARQLPKLKTRVRFPSPAPKIQPAFCRFNFYYVFKFQEQRRRTKHVFGLQTVLSHL